MKYRYICSSPDCSRSFMGDYREKFCDRCGSNMLSACPHCNEQLKSDQPYCRVCGQRVKAEPEKKPAR
jgi:rRNA maturation endonuclease Nob1